MNRYAYHGLRVVADLDLALPECGDSPCDLGELSIRGGDTLPSVPPPLWTSERTGYAYHDLGAGRALVSRGRDGFVVGEREIEVVFETWSAEARGYLLGAVMALWFELRGWPVLHASCVGVGAGAIGILGESTAGKSTLSASLVAAGCSLVSDDLLPLVRSKAGFVAYPSAASTRLWPDSAAQFVDDIAALERVVPSREKRTLRAEALGSAASGHVSLSALYILERRRDVVEVRIEPVAPGRALAMLVALSFQGEALDRFPGRPERFQSLAGVAREVSIRRLVYPSGFDRLPAVTAAVVADLEAAIA